MTYALAYVLIGLACMLADRLFDGWLWPHERHRVDLYVLAAWPAWLLAGACAVAAIAFERIVVSIDRKGEP